MLQRPCDGLHSPASLAYRRRNNDRTVDVIPSAGATGSTFTHLEGGLSHVIHPADRLMTVDPDDGRPLLARYDLERAGRRLGRGHLGDGGRPRGVWRWHELLPVRDWRHVVTLGEGATPLLAANRLGSAFGMNHLLVKAESLNPTGSFKARGMSVAVSRAMEARCDQVRHALGRQRGGSARCLRGSRRRRGDGGDAQRRPAGESGRGRHLWREVDPRRRLISDCGRLAARLADKTGAFNLSTLKEPYRVEGKKTMGIELAEDLGWSLPDAIVYPMGGGTGLVGMWKAVCGDGDDGADRSRPARA